MKDLYSVLGVPREAEADLIKATYIALCKIYHPDVYKGDKKYALKRMQDINEAYETLSDVNKRKAYDDKNKDTSDDTSFDENQYQEEQSSYQDIIKEAWAFAKEYYPDIEAQYDHLSKINKSLAWLFQIRCVENKQFERTDKIATKMLKKWLTIHFGEKEAIHDVALKAILTGKIDIAKELNKAIKLLGDNAHKVILTKLTEKHPEFFGITHKVGGRNYYKGYEYIPKMFFSGGMVWTILEAPQQASIGMEFEDEEKLKYYIDFKGGF